MLLHICGIGLQEQYGGSLHRQINDVMNIDQTLLDTLTEQAKASPRLRMSR